MEITLSTELRLIPGIGTSWQRRLAVLELKTVEDLIHHFPFRYDDFSHVTAISDVPLEQLITIQGQLWSIKNIHTKTRKVLTRAVLNDGTNSIELIWFNQSWLIKNLIVGQNIQVSGKVKRDGNKLVMMSPVWEKIAGSVHPAASSSLKTSTDNLSVVATSQQLPADSSLHTGRLVPVYPETAGISSKWFRDKISKILPQVINQIEEPLEESIRGDLIGMAAAIQQIHFPENTTQLEQAQNRLSFDELFWIQLASQKVRSEWKERQVIVPLNVTTEIVKEFTDKLPFELTSAQNQVIEQIRQDLNLPHPMNRLVQGEVGSGKTVVAAAIAYAVVKNGLRVLLMAPTEILAFQHHLTLSKLLSPLGIKVGLQTGSKKLAKSDQTAPSVVVGTHALVSQKFSLDDVGLVVIDEQQRFGVEQRAVLRARAKVPHFLTMTATPIPRTVALTIYGDLDVSVIDQLPVGRLPIKTHYVPAEKRDDAYKFIADQVAVGDQVYLITPLIEESESLSTVRAATVEFERLRKDIFPKLRMGLLHGRLKSEEKAQVLTDFKDHKIDILVSTSVVEVGVDVPNATIMLIEGSDRFGLAQIHQLRGRVGRGEKQSYCFLFTDNDSSWAVSRLKNLETINDGLKLAELDMKIRGSGEIFGTRQSGRFNLKIASLSDLSMIERARNAAYNLLKLDPQLDKYPYLRRKLQHLAQIAPD